MSNLTEINNYLKAKSSDVAGQSSVAVNQQSANNAFIADASTILGAQVGGDGLNGYLSLANNDIMTASGGVNTAGVPILLSNQVDGLVSSNPNLFYVDVAAGTFTVIDSAEAIQILSLDSVGVPLEDGEGNPITVPSLEVPSLNVTSVGTDAVSSITEITGTLTGIVPPAETISIVALGGAVVSELTNAIKVSSERKSSLMGQVKKVAGETSVEGLGDSIKESVSSVQGELEDAVNSSTLTQDVLGAVSAVENLGNEVANAAATAAGSLVGAITSTVGEVTSAIEDGFNNVLGEVTGAINDLVGDVVSQVTTGFGTAQDLFEDLTGVVGSGLQGLFGSSATLDKGFLSGILNDILEGGDINLSRVTKSLALKDTTLSPDMRDVIQNTEANSPQEFAQKVSTRAAARGIPAGEITKFQQSATKIETALSQIDTTISGTIVSEVGDFYTEDTDLAELVKLYLGSQTKNFEYVDSKEELGLEFRKITRPISEVIVHATETYTNANIGSEEIHRRHNEAGHNGIQYHYVIRRDGRLQRGMPLDDISSASDILGHSLNCIDVALVGGVNVPSEADDPLLNLSSSSFTQTQMKTLEALLSSFYQRVPGGQVLGHNSIDINSEDPYFDVVSFVENKFGKKSVYKDPLTESSLSAKDLISKRPV